MPDSRSREFYFREFSRIFELIHDENGNSALDDIKWIRERLLHDIRSNTRSNTIATQVIKNLYMAYKDFCRSKLSIEPTPTVENNDYFTITVDSSTSNSNNINWMNYNEWANSATPTVVGRKNLKQQKKGVL